VPLRFVVSAKTNGLVLLKKRSETDSKIISFDESLALLS